MDSTFCSIWKHIHRRKRVLACIACSKRWTQAKGSLSTRLKPRKQKTTFCAHAHRRTGRGGEGGCSPPPKFGQLRFLGSKRKFGQSEFLKTFPCFFYYYYFEEINIFYFNQKSAYTFTRDSGCLARDEFLVIREGYHMLIFLLLGTVLQWAISSRELIRINFRITF